MFDLFGHVFTFVDFSFIFVGLVGFSLLAWRWGVRLGQSHLQFESKSFSNFDGQKLTLVPLCFVRFVVFVGFSPSRGPGGLV